MKTSVSFQEDSHRKVGHAQKSGLTKYISHVNLNNSIVWANLSSLHQSEKRDERQGETLSLTKTDVNEDVVELFLSLPDTHLNRVKLK